MKTITMTELRAEPGERIRDVSRHGMRFLITKDGRPVAKLVPIDDGADSQLRLRLESIGFAERLTRTLCRVVEELGEADRPPGRLQFGMMRTALLRALDEDGTRCEAPSPLPKPELPRTPELRTAAGVRRAGQT